MKIFFLRLLFIVTFIFFEFSFFDVLFPWISSPLIIIVSVVSWALLVSFPHVLFMTISLTVLFDIVSAGAPGTLTLYGIFLVYMTSFLSRRLVLEHHGLGIVLYALFAAFGTLGFAISEFIFSWNKETSVPLFSLLSSQNLLLSVLLCIPLFMIVYGIIRKFEKYISSVAQGEVLKMK